MQMADLSGEGPVVRAVGDQAEVVGAQSAAVVEMVVLADGSSSDPDRRDQVSRESRGNDGEPPIDCLAERLRSNGRQIGSWCRDRPDRLMGVCAAAALLVLIAIGVLSWRLGVDVASLSRIGYPGVFLAMVISGAGMFFPGPYQATIFAAGAIWNPFLVGIAAGLGNATGELVGYGAGRAGGVLIEHRIGVSWLSNMRVWLVRYGFFAILMVALVPNPFFDFLGLLAGSMRFPVRRFWLACALGFTVKYLMYAHIGGAARAWWFSD